VTATAADAVVVAGVLVAAAGCAVAAVTAVRSRPGEPASWYAAAAWGLLALAHALLAVAVLGGTVGGPAAGLFVPIAAAGIVMLPGRPAQRVPERDWDALVVLLGSAAGVTALAGAVPAGGAAPSGLPPPGWLGGLACLALAAAALAPRRSQSVAGWVSGGLAAAAVGEALRRHASTGTPLGTSAAVTAAGFGLVAAGALARLLAGRGDAPDVPGPGVDRRRPAPPGLPARALSWLSAGGALAVLGAVVAGLPVATTAGMLAWAALGVLLLRGVVAFVRGGAPGDDRTDPLTGLASREAISQALATEGAARSGGGADDDAWSGWTDRVALLLADIDGFDEINVTLGRETGDAVLTEVGARLQAVLRPPQLLARLGGDEFAVLLPGAGHDPATRVAGTLREALSGPIDVGGSRLSLQATVGIAWCVLPRGRPEDLLRQADAAVHRAKATNSGIAVYDPEKDGAGSVRLRRVDELRSALEQGDVVVHLQPQVSLTDGAVVGCEALARWRHPHDGVLLPDAFLPLAATTGLMRPVTDVVLDRALEACATWWHRHPVAVGVNLAAGDLLDPGLTDRIGRTLARHGLPGAALRVEITEEALVAEPEAAARLLRAWRRTGVETALDDFGTGYSSLAYLRELPFDELKLDRVFGADLTRPATATIVRHSIAMAHELGLRVVAEGVEDDAAARALTQLGCDVGQGLFFGAAMPPAAFAALLAAADPVR
jgi:diguanylate cyclase (GGDEF)-like protein